MIMEFRVYRVIEQIEDVERRANISLICDETGVLMELAGPMSKLDHLRKGDSYPFGAP